VAGRPCWTMFDTGARYSYIVRSAAEALDRQPLAVPRTSALGGQVHKVEEVCLVFAKLEGQPLEIKASVLENIGQDEDGRPIEVLFGAIEMQMWGIKLDPQNERLDLSHFTKEFVEF
jgi:aspartyl protease